MKIGWVDDPRFLRHVPGGVHVERPARLQVILRAVREAALLEQLVPVRFQAATTDQLALVHDPAYIEVVRHIFERRSDVLYISLHERPEAPAFPGTGYASETGQGAGAGFTLNVPLDRGCGPSEYLQAVDREVLPALDDYRPQWLLISAGFDALAGDNVANLSLEPESFGPLTERLVAVANRHSQGRVVSVLEGGYDLAQLGSAVVAHLQALGR